MSVSPSRLNNNINISSNEENLPALEVESSDPHNSSPSCSSDSDSEALEVLEDEHGPLKPRADKLISLIQHAKDTCKISKSKYPTYKGVGMDLEICLNDDGEEGCAAKENLMRILNDIDSSFEVNDCGESAFAEMVLEEKERLEGELFERDAEIGRLKKMLDVKDAEIGRLKGVEEKHLRLIAQDDNGEVDGVSEGEKKERMV